MESAVQPANGFAAESQLQKLQLPQLRRRTLQLHLRTLLSAVQLQFKFQDCRLQLASLHVHKPLYILSQIEFKCLQNS